MSTTLKRAFFWSYVPSAAVCLAFISSCSMRETLCLDYDYWDFRTATSGVVIVTPLSSGRDGAEHVVPRHGWQQTEFELAPAEQRAINLETGDFPFDRVLVESPTRPPWTVPVDSSSSIVIREGGPRATSAQLAAKTEPSRRRFKLYLTTALLPLIWTLPILLLVWWSKTRSRPLRPNYTR
jgi:hypothetical protein